MTGKRMKFATIEKSTAAYMTSFDFRDTMRQMTANTAVKKNAPIAIMELPRESEMITDKVDPAMAITTATLSICCHRSNPAISLS